MMTWLMRGLFCISLIALVVCGLLYFGAVAMVEAWLQPQLEARGGELEIDSIRVGFSGVEFKVERYEDTELVVRGLAVSYPWSLLGSIREGFGGSLHIKEVKLRLGHESNESDEGELVSLADRVAGLVEEVDSLPLSGLAVVVDRLLIERSEQVLRYGAELTFLRGANGETHLAAMVAGEGGELDVRVRISAGGAGLSLDFVASADDWADFQRAYLPGLSDQLAAWQAELYLSPLGEGRGFLDVSGYVRWNVAQPEVLSFTTLADLGEAEMYFPSGELILQRTSVGVTSDGGGRDRAYGKGGISAVRIGSWIQSGGDWSVRGDGSKIVAELRVSDAVSLSLGHDDWRQLWSGSGRGRFYLEASSVDAELLRGLKIDPLPDDLVLDMGLEVEGEGALENWQAAGVSVGVNAEVAAVSVASKGLSATNLEVQMGLALAGAELEPKSFDLRVESLDLLGFIMKDLAVATQMDDQGRILVAPVKADFIGGILRIDAMRIDLDHLEGTPFRARLEAVDLSQLAKAVPQFKGEVSGQVSGYLVGELKDGQPILTDGRLEVDPAAGARLSYNVRGLLTRGMAEGSTAYKQYRMAELAFEDLALKRFSIDVFPEGNATRPFRLELLGESLQGKTIVPVDFNLNVNVDDTAGLLELLRMIQRGELEF